MIEGLKIDVRGNELVDLFTRYSLSLRSYAEALQERAGRLWSANKIVASEQSGEDEEGAPNNASLSGVRDTIDEKFKGYQNRISTALAQARRFEWLAAHVNTSEVYRFESEEINVGFFRDKPLVNQWE